MRQPLRPALLVAVLACALPAAAQQPTTASQAAGSPAPSVTADLLRDVDQAQQKFIDLAKTIPAEKYEWRPAQGVRSVGEVLMHVAADNYLLAAVGGFAPDAATGIKADDYKTAVAFEQKKLNKDATIAELERSFAHFKKGLTGTTAAQLTERVPVFGQQMTRQQLWILSTTHLHEHLGQLIAYARSNGVKPPWSQGS